MRFIGLLRYFFTAAMSVWLCANAAQAATLYGASVTGALYYPTSSTLYLSSPFTVVIGPSVEFPNGLIVGDSSFQIDVTSNQLIYHPLQSVQYGGGANVFNGFRFTFSNSPEIVGVSINNAASNFLPSSPDAFDFTANTLSFNLQGLSVNASSYLVFDLVLANSVPEPSTWAMIILGFACMGAMAFRRKLKLAD